MPPGFDHSGSPIPTSRLVCYPRSSVTFGLTPIGVLAFNFWSTVCRDCRVAGPLHANPLNIPGLPPTSLQPVPSDRLCWSKSDGCGDTLCVSNDKVQTTTTTMMITPCGSGCRRRADTPNRIPCPAGWWNHLVSACCGENSKLVSGKSHSVETAALRRFDFCGVAAFHVLI